MSNPSLPISQPHWTIQLLQVHQARQEHSYLPYASGLLQAYAQTFSADPSRYTFLPIRFDRIPIEQLLKQIQIADVFGFSNYIWNMEYSLATAKAIKAIKPQALTIFGGPQVPDQAEAFLREHPEVDVCVHGEGELAFLALLEALPSRDWRQIGSISYLDAEGVFHCQPRTERIRDFSDFPSPYLMGVFDLLMLAHPRYSWVAMWETNRGCPFSCAFCDWGSATQAKVNRKDFEQLKQEMEWFGRHKIDVINLCDANFGIFPRDLEITDYMIDVHQRTGFPRIFFTQTAKNVEERAYQIQKKIVNSGMSEVVALALQSVTPQTLKAIKRENISLATFRQLQHRFHRDGINTYSDVLMGLPGETYESFAEGVETMVAEGQHHLLQFFNVYTLPNAELNQPEYRAQHQVETITLPYYEPFFPLKVEVQEKQEMVISTATLPPADWRRTRLFAWWAELLYFYPKLLQIPMLLMHHYAGLRFREMFEFYYTDALPQTPMLRELQRFFEAKIVQIRAGEPEYCLVKNVGRPYWLSVKDFVITGLYPDEVHAVFYQEQRRALEQLLAGRQALPPGLLDEAIDLAQRLFHAFVKREPFSMELSYNVWEIYQCMLENQPWQLKRGRFRHVLDDPGYSYQRVRVEDLSISSVY